MVTRTLCALISKAISYARLKFVGNWIGVITVFATLVVFFDGDAIARGRGRGSSRAAAAARKQQMIRSLQQHLAVARQILATARSQTAMSSAEVNQAIGKLSELRESIDSAQIDVKEASKALHDVEEEILDAQSSDSQVKEEERALERAKAELHESIHRAVKIADKPHRSADAGRLTDIAGLSDEDRSALEADSAYQAAKQKVSEANRKLNKTRQLLYDADSDWIAARDELHDAHKRADEGRRQASSVAIGSLDDRQDLRKAKNVAAAAQAAVMQAEMRLRQLGVKDATGASAPTSRR